MAYKFVRFDNDEAAKMLIDLAKQDLRSEGNEVIWLIQQEWERRMPAGAAVGSLVVTLCAAEAEGEKEGDGLIEIP